METAVSDCTSLASHLFPRVARKQSAHEVYFPVSHAFVRSFVDVLKDTIRTHLGKRRFTHKAEKAWESVLELVTSPFREGLAEGQAEKEVGGSHRPASPHQASSRASMSSCSKHRYSQPKVVKTSLNTPPSPQPGSRSADALFSGSSGVSLPPTTCTHAFPTNTSLAEMATVPHNSFPAPRVINLCSDVAKSKRETVKVDTRAVNRAKAASTASPSEQLPTLYRTRQRGPVMLV
eukprot:m.168348 g.168348  ORF g.168348 m.168348 type:complete len:234 (+) comp14473_c0_seq6:1381-2082(+)